MLHDVGFLERDHAAGLKGHDVDGHVVAQIVGIDEAGGGPGPVGIGHRGGRDVGIRGYKRLRRGEAGGGLVELADPVKARRVVLRVAQPPGAAGRDVGVAAGAEVVLGAVKRQPDFAFGDEDHALRAGVGFGGIRAAAGGDRHHILAEGFRESRHRAGDQPQAGALPTRQAGGHDVGKHPARDEGVGRSKDGAAGQQAGLGRQAAGRAEVGGHGSMSLRRSSAMRSTCAQAVANSVASSLARRRWKAARRPTLAWSRTAMMKGKPKRVW